MSSAAYCALVLVSSASCCSSAPIPNKRYHQGRLSTADSVAVSASVKA
jgi:hypothetical protein